MATFNELWQLLYDHGSTNYYKHDCAELWDNLMPAQQQGLFDRLSERLQRNQYVAYNPLEAMRDNLPRKAALPPAPPTNYNGSREFDALVKTGRLCTAEYNGQVGIYTIDDATAHHMTIIKRLQP